MSDQIAPLNTNFLPNGYNQLTYIESSGVQYIDTGFKPDNNTRVVIDFEGKNSDLKALFGARNGSSAAAFGMWTRSSIYPHYGNIGYTGNGSFGINPNARLVYELNKNVCNIGTETIICAEYTFTANCSLFLLNFNTAGVSDGRCSAGKLYSCQIYDNDILVRDFIPCQNANREVGLWDSVYGTFYKNAGTGEFIPGSIIKPVVRSSNVIKPKHGATPPKVNDLQEYELGYHGGALYVREDNKIVKISGGGGGDTEQEEKIIKEMFITEEIDGSISMRNIFEDDSEENIKINIDENGNPSELIYNNTYIINISWVIK